MHCERLGRAALAFVGLTVVLWPCFSSADEAAAGSSKEIQEIRRSVRQLQQEREKDRQERKRDSELIDKLLRRLDQVESENRDLRTSNQQLQGRTTQLQGQTTQTSEQVKELATKVESVPSASSVQQALSGFWGDHRFVLAGDFAIDYKWNDRDHKNSFSLENFAPIFLFQAGERLLFEGEVEFALTPDGSDIPELEYAQADYVLNDYMTIVAGKFILPFGDFLERQHQKWIMKLVDRPLLYRTPNQGGVMQDNGVGVQLRGAIPLGYGEGAFAEYSAYVVNGPRFESADSGAFFADNHVDNNQGKGYGARLGLDVLPIDYKMGRLHLSVSTYDGEWDSTTATKGGDKHWFTSWGVGFDYLKLPFELRGEYLSDNRNMPRPRRNDHRQGWYLEGSYMLNELPIDYLRRFELVARWSGVNQNTIPEDDSFTAFTRKPREISLGIDYWLAPSEVVKFEYERVIQHDARDFNALFTSFAYGF
jgi:uncharacterized protein YoxC